MTAPSDPEAGPERLEEEQEIVLRLSDILPRVPAHLLKPGPHDGNAQVRFSVEELAEKISRGRVSVPLERLSTVCPQVFRDRSAFPGEQEVPLPLQKLLEQVGLVVPKAAANGIPRDQLAQARAEAGRIIGTNTPAAPSAPAAPTVTPTAPAPEPEPAQPASSPRIAKAISTARHLLGLLGLQNETIVPPPEEEKPADVTPPAPAQEQEPPPPPPITPPPPPTAISEPTPPPPPPPPPPVQEAPPAEPPPEPAPQQPAGGCVSLHVLPIFRLLSPPVLKSGDLPPRDARVSIPLSLIDPQLAGGHVEIPMAEFFKALPENLRHMIEPGPGTQVWIPLDEIFQNLPTDHLFYMPMFDPLAEPAADLDEVPAPYEAKLPAAIIEAPAVTEPEKSEPVAARVETEPKQPEAVAATVEGAELVEAKPAPPEAPKEEHAPDPPAQPAPVVAAEAAAEPAIAPEAAAMPAIATEAPTEPVATPEAATEPAPVESARVPEPPAPESLPEAAPELTVEPSPAPAEIPPPSRAPWMRGFQIPPPRLFANPAATAEALPEAPPAEPPPPPATPATPEARRTVDFLAGQPGIFAAAAFVEGAVFASTDFPRKPDLDALRDFMGTFIETARESGRRLGWNQVLTLPCEQFHLTAIVRETHFVVALHHDRVLPTLTYEALVAAAEELSKAAA